MKTIFKLSLVAALFALSSAAFGQQFTGFLTKVNVTAGTNNNVVFPGSTSRQVVLKSMLLVGDNADAVLTVYSGSYQGALNYALAYDATNVRLASTNGFQTGKCIIQRADGTATLHTISAVGATNLTISPAAGTAGVVGDKVWYCGLSAAHTIGSNTVRLVGDLHAAQVRAPLALDFFSTAGTTEKIQAATVKYEY